VWGFPGGAGFSGAPGPPGPPGRGINETDTDDDNDCEGPVGEYYTYATNLCQTRLPPNLRQYPLMRAFSCRCITSGHVTKMAVTPFDRP